ncbi:MAG: efflux RND transporter permease subunit [Bacteroidia bacterium]|nr:efflux RND transporter permease subunit [Bacteroidia bacterium]
MSITELSIKRPSLIVVIFSVLGFLGILSYSKLNYELMPKFSIPVVTVTTVYPGASPAEVENSVTKKLEDALSNLENLDEIKSTSMEGVASVVLMLKPDANSDLVVQDAQRKINAILSQLPDDVLSPSIGKYSMDERPIMRLGLTAKIPPTELYNLTKNEVLPSLSRLKGAAQVSIVGGEEREIKVNVDRQACEARGISMLQIIQVLQSSNMDFPVGKIENAESKALIRLKGKYQTIEDIQNLVITTDRVSGSPVRLAELATVTDGIKDIKTINRIDGKNSIGLTIQKQSDANAVALSALVKKEIQTLEKAFDAQGLQFEIASDTSDFTLEAANSVMKDLGLAIFIVALVMLLFLHSFRNSLIVMVAIPASLISVFIAMYLLGFSLNLMTLLAISLVVGILVDDSIVVLENIYRHLEMGQERREASIKGRKEIGFTAMGITLVDVVVFLPLTMVGGLISNLLSQFSIVIVISTLMSLFVSFTLTPLLASRLAKIEHINKKLISGKIVAAFEQFLNWLTNSYGSLLKVALTRKRYVLIATIALLVASFMLIGKGYIGSEFVSQGDRGEFVISLELKQDATIEQTNLTAQKVEDYLFQNEDVTNVFTSIGTSSNGMGGNNSVSNKAELNVKLVDKKDREYPADLYAQMVKHDLEKILPGVKVSSAAVSIMGTANAAPVQISVTGNSPDSNYAMANRLMDELKSIKGTAEVTLSVETGNPEINVEVDRDKMASLGLSMSEVGANLQAAFNGNNSSRYNEAGNEYDISVIYDEFNRQSVNDISNLPFINKKGEVIRLSQFATTVQSTGASKLERKNRVPSMTVSSQVLGISSGAVTSKMNQYLADNPPPANVVVAFEGNAKNMGEAFANLGFALIASILFVYLIMVALYDSYVYPFVVLFSIPVAIVGALLALALTMQPLSIFSMLGMIMLIGLVAKNAILIVDFANQLKAEGMNTANALIHAGKTRLRPILMTTLAMVFGMMPIALATGPGAEWKSGLAWVLIGGLSSSMLLTLVVVPCVYLIFDIFKGEISNKKAKGILRGTIQEDETMQVQVEEEELQPEPVAV